MIINLFKPIEYYKSIGELPYYHWSKLNESHNVKWLLKGVQDCNVKHIKQLEKQWSQINDEFIDTFGVSEEYNNILELQRDILILKLQMISSQDMTLQNFIDIKEAELKNIFETNNKQTKEEVKAYVEKYMGFKLNEKEVTVKEFYTYVNVLKKDTQVKAKVNG